MTGQSPRERVSGRVILLDERGRVLLIRFRVPKAGSFFVFWATPGGEVEPGEGALEAARRELAEEVGLRSKLVGPVHRVRAEFEHLGVPVASDDIFFLARCEADEPVLNRHTEEERAVLQEIRWWTADALRRATEPVFPPELAEVVERLARTEPPSSAA